MHMADALISPAVGVAMWTASAGLIGYCSKKVKDNLDDHKIPLKGVIGAFIFAAQMINFTIPGTGSSGHIGGHDPGYPAGTPRWNYCRMKRCWIKVG